MPSKKALLAIAIALAALSSAWANTVLMNFGNATSPVNSEFSNIEYSQNFNSTQFLNITDNAENQVFWERITPNTLGNFSPQKLFLNFSLTGTNPNSPFHVDLYNVGFNEYYKFAGDTSSATSSASNIALSYIGLFSADPENTPNSFLSFAGASLVFDGTGEAIQDMVVFDLNFKLSATWTTGSGNWTTSSQWKDDGLPENSYEVEFAGADGGTSTNNFASGNLSTISGISFLEGAGAYTVDGNTLQIGDLGIVNASNQTQTIAINLTLGANQTFAANTANLVVSGNISGGYLLTKEGNQTLTLGGSNTYTGITTLSAGTLALGNADALSGSTLDHSSNATLGFILPGANTYNIGGLAGDSSISIGNNTLSIGANNESTGFSGAVSGTGSLTKSGTGALTLSGSNTYSGNTTINEGALVIASTGQIAPSIAPSITNQTEFAVAGENSTASVTLDGGSISNFAGYIGFGNGSTGTVNINSGTWTNSENLRVGYYGNGTLNLTGGNVSNVNGIIGRYSGSNGVANVSGGTWSSSGTLRIGQEATGTLNLTGGNVVVASGTGNVTIGQETGSSGTLNLGNGSTAGSLQAARVSGGNGTAVVNFNHTGNYSFAPILDGSLSVNKLGTGTTTLTGNNSYAGGTFIESGTLTGNNLGLKGNITNNATLLLTNGSSYQTEISGTGNLLVANSATLLGNATMAGGTTIQSGTLTIGGRNSALTFILGSIAEDITNEGALQFDMNTGNRTYSGVISGNGSLASTSSGYSTPTGILTLTGNNTFTGGTTFSQGTLDISGGSLAATGNVTIEGGSFDIGASNQTIGNFKIKGFQTTEAKGSGTLTASSYDLQQGTVSFSLNGTAGLAKNTTGSGSDSYANGVVHLSGNNTATGNITVNAGILSFNTVQSLYSGNNASWTPDKISVSANSTLALGTGDGSATSGFSDTQIAEIFASLTQNSTGTLTPTTGLTAGSSIGFNVASGDFTLNSTISDRADLGVIGLDKIGAGALVLGSSNTFTGPINIYEGTIRAGTNNALSNSTSLVVSLKDNTRPAIYDIGEFNQQFVNVTLLSGILNGGNGTINATGNYTMVSGDSRANLAGVAPLLKTGSGSAYLYGNSTYLGHTTINGTNWSRPSASDAKLQFQNPVALYTDDASKWNGGNITVNQYGIFSVRADDTGVQGFTENRIATLITNLISANRTSGGLLAGSAFGIDTAGTNMTLSTALTDSTGQVAGGGAIAFVKYGTGTLTLNGTNNTHSLATSVTGGTLALAPGTTLSASNATISVQNASLDLGTTNQTVARVEASNGSILGSGTLTATAGDYYFSSSNITVNLAGNVGASISSPGTTTLWGNNTHTGNTAVYAGAVLSLANLNAVVASTLMVYDGSTTQFAVAGANTYNLGGLGGTANIAFGNNTLSIGANNQSTSYGSSTGSLSGTGSVIKIGNGTLTFAGNNNYSGGTTISAGTLALGSGGTAGSVTGDITNNAALVFNRSDNSTYSGIVSGNGSVTKNGAGLLTLSGISTYTGNTTINTGTLGLDGTLASTAISIASGAGLNTSGGVSENAAVANSGNFTVNAADTIGSLSGSGNTILNAALTTGALGTADEISGTITGNAALTKAGTGTLSLTGSATNAGGLVISSGTVSIGNGSTSGSITGNITNNAALVFNRSNDSTFTAGLSGTGSLEKLGAGVLTLANGTRTVGATTINGGGLVLSNASTLNATSAVANSGAITIGQGSSLVVSGSTPIFQNTPSLFVANLGAHSISVFNLQNSQFLSSISGNMSFPYGMAFDGSGNLYVANELNNTLGKFSSNGTFLSSISGNMNGPRGVAIDGSGNLYVANNYNNTVSKFSSNGTFLSSISGNMSVPSGVAIDGSGNLYVANQNNNTLSKFSSNGTFLSSISGNMNSPRGVAIDGSGNLYVPNANNNTLSKFSSNGTFLSSISGNLSSPAGLAIDGSGNLYVANNSGSTVSKFSSNGTFLSSISGNMSGPSGLAIGNYTTETVTLSGLTLAENSSDNVTLNLGTYGGSDTTATLTTPFIAFGNGTAALNLNLASNYTLSSDLTGGNSNSTLNQLGTGTTTLTGNNSFIGATAVNAGKLIVNSNLASTAISIASGAGLETNGGLSANSSVANSGTLTINATETIGSLSGSGNTILNADLTTGALGQPHNPDQISGIISGIGAITFNSIPSANRASALTANNTYTGSTTVGNSTLILSGNGSIASSSALTLGANGRLSIGSVTANSSTVNNLSSLDSTATIELASNTLINIATDNRTFYGTIGSGNPGGFTKRGNGTLTLAGNNDYFGATTIEEGVLFVSGSLFGTYSSVAPTAVSVSSGATYQLGSNDTVGSIAGAGSIDLDSFALTLGVNTTTADTTFSGVVSGANGGSLIKAGTGTLTLTGNNTYTGTTTVKSGTLQVATGGSIAGGELYIGEDSGDNGTLNLTGGSINHSGINDFIGSTTSGTGIGTANVSAGTWVNDEFAIGQNGIGTINLSGTGNITSNGGAWLGGLTDGYSDTGSGTANVSGGSWTVGGLGLSVGLSGTGILNLSGGNVTHTGASGAGNYVGWYAGALGTANVSGGTWSTNEELSLGGDGGTGILNLSGTGLVTNTEGYLAGSAYPAVSGVLGVGVANISGGSWINSGNLTVGLVGNGTLNLTENGTVTVGGLLTLASDAGSTGTLNLGNGTTAGTLSAATITGGNGAALVNINQNASYTLGSNMTGSLSLNHIGTGTTTLTGNSTYTGSTTVNAGTLAGTTSSLQGYITNNAVVNFDQGNDGTYAGAMSGTGTLVKTGTGTLILTGSNTYTGDTAVNGGVLEVNTSLQNTATEVNSGGTLAGTGTLGVVTINSGGTIAPGNSPGTIRVGDMVWNGGGTYAWELGNAIGTAGTAWDLISSSGSLTINADSSTPFTIAASTTNASGFDPSTKHYSWKIAEFSSILNFSAEKFNISPTGFDSIPDIGYYSISSNGNALSLNYATMATWNAGTGNWTTSGNWEADFAPINGVKVEYAGPNGSGGTSDNNSGLANILGLEFTSGANASYTIAGGNLTIGADGIVNNSTSTQTVAINLTLGADQTFAANTANLVVSGDITGDNSLTKAGNETLTFAGANTYTGETNIDAGTLAIASGGSLSGTSKIFVGNSTSSNNLSILGAVSTADLTLSHQVGSDNNTVTVGGGTSPASLTVANLLNVGFGGTGNTLDIFGNGTVTAGSTEIGGYGANNSLNLTGGVLNSIGYLVVGYFADGNALNITAGGNATVGSITAGLDAASANNTILVSGTGSALHTAGLIYLGENGTSNSLVIENGGKVVSQNADAVIGFNAGSNGNALSINGTGSQFTNNGTLYVGKGGSENTLAIDNGGSLTTRNARIGHDATSSNNTATISGTGSTWTNTGTLRVGSAGSGNTLAVTSGANVTVGGNTFIGHGAAFANNLLSVEGAGSTFKGGNLTVGLDGSSSNLTVSNGGNVSLAGALAIGYNAASPNNTATVSGAGSVLSAQNIQIGGGADNKLIVADSGLVSTANITLAGTDATLQIGEGGAAGNLSLTGSILTSGTVRRTVVFNHTDSAYQFASAMNGDLSVSQIGNGTTILTANNTYSSITTVNNGTLAIATGGSINGSSNIFVGLLSGDNGTLNINGGSVSNAGGLLGINVGSVGTAIVSAGNWTNSGDLYVGLQGTGSLTINGTGNVTNIDGYIGHAAGSNGTVSVSGGIWANRFLFIGNEGTGSLTIGGTGNVTNSDGYIGNLPGGNGAVNVSGGTWTNSSNLAIGGAGTGSLTINSTGTVIVGDTLSRGSNGTINLESGGTLQIGNGGTTGMLATDLTNNGTLLLDRSSDSTYSDQISGTGVVIKNGTGQLVFTGNNTYSGGTTVNAGTLAGTTSSLQGYITNNAVVNFDQGNDGTYAGAMSGTGTLVKTGTGTLILTGSNTYTGDTAVNGGVLEVNTSLQNTATVVNSGGTLGGIGTLGAVTINSGGTIAPGNSPGTIRVGDMAWNGGGTYAWELGNATGTAGTGWDLISSTGSLTIGADSTNKFTIAASTTNASGFDPSTKHYSWKIAEFSSILNFSADKFNISPTGFDSIPDIGYYSISSNGNALSLNYATMATWNAGTGNWTNTNNWEGNAAPINGVKVEYAGPNGSGGTSDNNGGLANILGLEFTSGANASYTIAGGNLTIGEDGIVNNSTSTQTVAINLTLGADQTFAANTANLVVSGNISGNASLTKAGNETLTFAGANTYTGETNIDAGTLAIASGGSLTGTSKILIGNSSSGNTMSVLGSVSTGNLTLSEHVGSDDNTLTVGGGSNPASLTVGNLINVGFGGEGNLLEILGNGTVTAASTWIGGYGDNNTLEVTGGVLNSTSDVVVGYFADDNDLNITAGGNATVGSVTVGLDAASSNNTILVSGTGSALNTAGLIYLGESGSSNSLVIKNGGKVVSQNADAVIGFNAGSNGNALSINGSGSQFTNNGTLYVGKGGSENTLAIDNGGSLITRNGRIGHDATSSNNTATISGTGSTWTNTGTLRVGSAGSNNTLAVTSGANVTVAGNTFIGHGAASANNLLSVEGAGSTFKGGNLTVGLDGSSSNLTVSNGGNVSLAGALAIGYNAASSNNTATVSGAGSVLSAQNIQIGGGADNKLVVSDSGTVSAANIYFNGANATLQIGNGGAAGNLALTGSILTLGDAAGRAVLFNHTDPAYQFASAMSGDLAVSQIGTGKTILTANNTYSGTTTVKNGTLEVATGGSINSTADIFVGLLDGDDGTLHINGGSVSNAAGYLGKDDGSFGTAIVSSGNWTNSEEFFVGWSGTGNLTISGGQVSNTSSEVAYRSNSNGTVTVSGGTWANSGELNIARYGTGTLTISGGNVTNTDGSIGVHNGSNGTVNVSGGRWSNSGNLYIGASTFGRGSLTISGTGNVANTDGNVGFGSNGTVSVSGGTWTNSGNLTIGEYGTGVIAISGGNVTNTNGIIGVESVSTGMVSVSGGTWANSSNLTVGVSGTGSLTINGTGTVIVGDTLSRGSNGTINLASGGTLQIGTGGDTGTLATDLTNDGTLLFDRSSNSTYSSVISGTGVVIKNGTGTLVFTANNTYTGGTSVNQGTLYLQRDTYAGALFNMGNVTVANGATLMSARGNLLGNLALNGGTWVETNGWGGSLAGSVELGATSTFQTDYEQTVTANITGTGGLVKTGAGTLLLSGSNSYSGTTAINSGTLLVNGSQPSSATTVNSGGTLGGNGTLGAVTITSGAAIAPGTGDSLSILTVGNSVWNGNGTYNWQLGNAAGTAGSGWDLISSAGSLTINATAGEKFVINATALADSGFDSSTASYKWQMASFSGNITGFSTEKFAINPSGFNGTSGIGVFSVSANSTALALNYRTLFVWDTGNGTWSTDTNWLDNALPVNDAPIEFAGLGGTSTNNDYLTSISGLTFTANAGEAYTLAGGNLSIGASGITNNSAYAQTVGMDIILGANQTFAANTENLIVSGNIAGGYSLTKEGSETLTLSGNAAHTGGTTISTGTLVVEGLVGGVTNNATFNVQQGGVAGSVNNLVGGTATNIGTVASLSNAGNFTNSGNITGNVTTSGTLAGSGRIGGTLGVEGGLATVGADGSVEGTSTVSSGTLAVLGTVAGVTNNATFRVESSGEAGSVSNLAGGTATNNGTVNSLSNVGNFTNSGNITGSVTTSGTLAGSGRIGGTLGVEGGVATIGSGGQVSGASTVDSGSFVVSGTVASVSNNASFTVQSGGVAGAVDNLAGGTATNNGTVALLANAGTFTNSGNITGGVTTNGTLASNGRIGEALEINDGSATIGNGGQVSGTSTVNSGSLVVSGTVDGVSNNASFAVQSGGMAGSVSNLVGATGTNNGTVATLANAGTFTNGGNITGGVTTNGTFASNGRIGGALEINDGSATIGNGGQVSGTSTVNAGSLVVSGTVAGVSNNASFTVQSGGMAGSVSNLVGATGTNSGTAASLANAGTFTNGGNIAGNVTTSGALSSSGNIVGALTIGGGETTISGTVAGPTTISAGVLQGNGTLGAVTLNSGGTIAPGTGNGTATIRVGNSVWNGGGIYNWQTASLNGTAGNGWDLITSSGMLTLNATLENQITMNLSTLGDASLTDVKKASWEVGNFTTGITGFDKSFFRLNPDSMAGNDGRYFMSLGSGNTTLVLNYKSAATWNTGSGNWTTASQWEDDSLPENGDEVEFAGLGGTSTNNFASGNLSTISGFNFVEGARAYTVNGNTLQIGEDGIINASGNLQTIGMDLTAGNELVLNAAAGDIAISGAISGNSLLTKTGNATLTLTGNNIYSGGTTVAAGTLAGTTTGLQGAITNNAVVNFDQAFHGTYAGAMSGTGSLTKSGIGIVQLSGNNSYSGGTTINSGVLAASVITGNLVTLNPNAFGTGGVAINTGGAMLVPSTTLGGGRLAIGNDLTLNNGTIAFYDIGTSPEGQDLRIDVAGNFTNAGNGVVFDFSQVQALDSGNYTLVSYNGTNFATNAISSRAGVGTTLQGSFSFSNNGSSLVYRVLGAQSSGTDIQNNGGPNTPIVSNYTINQPGVVTIGQSNTVAALTFNSGGSLIIQQDGVLYITSGTLNVQNGSSVVSGGTLVAPAGLNKDGPGELDFTNNVVVTGTLSVNSGLLSVNRMLFFTSNMIRTDAIDALIRENTPVVDWVMVNPNATLGGSGLIVGNVNINGGNLSPGNSPGTLSIAGNLVLTGANATLIEIESPTNFDRLIVSGQAALGGTLNAVTYGGGTITPGARYDILQAGSIVGAFDSLIAPDGLRVRFLNSGTVGTLLFGPDSYVPMSLNPNEKRVASALDTFIVATDGDRLAVSIALDSLTTEQFPSAFDQIMPGFYESLANIAIEQAFAQTQMLNQRISSVRLGAAGFQAIGGISQPLMHDKNGKSAADAKDANPIVESATATNWNSWALGTGMFSRSTNLPSLQNYNNDAGGFLVGADYRWSENFVSGLYAGYDYSYAEYNGGGSTKGNSVNFGTYASYAKDGYYADAVIGGGYTAFQTKRSIQFSTIDRTASADPGSGQFTAGINLGKDFEVGKFTLGPIIGAQYTYAGIGGFTESGAESLDLSLGQQNANSLRSTLGGRIAYTWNLNQKITLIPEVRMFWQHEFLNNSRNINASLDGGNGAAFDFETTAPYRNSVFAGAGVTAQFGERWNASLFYNVNFGSQTYQSNMVSAGLNFSF